jgi:hypothetical protein
MVEMLNFALPLSRWRLNACRQEGQGAVQNAHGGRPDKWMVSDAPDGRDAPGEGASGGASSE